LQFKTIRNIIRPGIVSWLYQTAGPLFFADTTVNKRPSRQAIVDTILTVTRTVKWLGEKPIVAMLSLLKFGSSKTGSPGKSKRSCKILQRKPRTFLWTGNAVIWV